MPDAELMIVSNTRIYRLTLHANGCPAEARLARRQSTNLS